MTVSAESSMITDMPKLSLHPLSRD
jgi:hypothetical protein